MAYSFERFLLLTWIGLMREMICPGGWVFRKKRATTKEDDDDDEDERGALGFLAQNRGGSVIMLSALRSCRVAIHYAYLHKASHAGRTHSDHKRERASRVRCPRRVKSCCTLDPTT